VKNRSSQDVKDNVPVSKGLEKEDQYFRERYPDLLDAGLAGTRSLVNRLSMILSKNIQSSLPDITGELREKIDSYE